MMRRSLPCDCGGIADLSSEPLFGATVETCSGACGYSGAPRPSTEPPPLKTPRPNRLPQGAWRTSSVALPLCAICETRRVPTAKCTRCARCTKDLHRTNARERMRRLAAARRAT